MPVPWATQKGRKVEPETPFDKPVADEVLPATGIEHHPTAVARRQEKSFWFEPGETREAFAFRISRFIQESIIDALYADEGRTLFFDARATCGWLWPQGSREPTGCCSASVSLRARTPCLP